MSVVATESIISFLQLAYTKKNVVIAKDCLWIELQNYCVASTEKSISLFAD